jgi:hypothetical protein
MSDLRGRELALATLDYIDAHPEEWDQYWYICGTTACFAGRALLIVSDGTYPSPHPLVIAGLGHRGAAMELLGWNEAEADHVFYDETGDPRVLRELVMEVLNGEVLERPA